MAPFFEHFLPCLSGCRYRKGKKYIEMIHSFDLSDEFCSHFHRFCPFWLLFYMKYYDVHRFFCILLTNFQNSLENVGFCFKVNQDKNPLKHETFTLRCQKYFLKHFEWLFRGCSINMEKPCAHRGISCKISAKTDKISGNESKMRMSSQIYGFFQ